VSLYKGQWDLGTSAILSVNENIAGYLNPSGKCQGPTGFLVANLYHYNIEPMVTKCLCYIKIKLKGGSSTLHFNLFNIANVNKDKVG
jgi:hypothetical protein